jgi:dihydroneopterin aldolase
MRFQARVGILPGEREASQPIEIDLRVHVADGPANSEVLDYRALYDLVARVVNSRHIDYLEEIVDRIAADALAHSTRVQRVSVAVRKPQVVLGGPLAYAEVAIERDAAARDRA